MTYKLCKTLDLQPKVIREIPIGEEGSQLNFQILFWVKYGEWLESMKLEKRWPARKYFAAVVVQLSSRVQLFLTPWQVFFFFFSCQILDLEMFSPILWDLKIFSWQCSFIYKSFKFWWVQLSFLLFPVFWGSYLSDHYLLKGYEDLLMFFFS